MAYPQTSPILDFTVVDSHNLQSLGIADTSFYPSNFQVINPTFEITPPGFTKAVIPYTVNGLMFLNSNHLNITCVTDFSMLAELPDGIWIVTQTIAPPIRWNLTRSFMRTMRIEQRMGKAFMKADMACSPETKREQIRVIDEIDFYIQGAIAAANQCNNVLAMNLYHTASSMLDNFLRDRCRGVAPTLWC